MVSKIPQIMNRRSASALALEGRRWPASADHQGQLPAGKGVKIDGTLCAEGSPGRRSVSPVGGRAPCRPHGGCPSGSPASSHVGSWLPSASRPRLLPVGRLAAPTPSPTPPCLSGQEAPLRCTAPGSALLTPPGEGVVWSFSAYKVGKSALGRKVLLVGSSPSRAHKQTVLGRPAEPRERNGRRSRLVPVLPHVTERQSQTP